MDFEKINSEPETTRPYSQATHNSGRNLLGEKNNAPSEPQTSKSIRLSDPIINADLATQNEAISAKRVAEQTLHTQ